MVKVGSTYYLFYEAHKVDDSTTICYSTSSDGYSGWSFGGEVLNSTNAAGEDNISFPVVYNVDGNWWMIPCLTGKYINLYKATSFPDTWEYAQSLIFDNGGNQLRDPALFQFNGTFYIILGDTTDEVCRLYYSDTLYGENAWTEHPQSPITSGTAHYRPGGRPIVRADRVDIFFQDDSAGYGDAVRIYQLTNLTKTTVTATELAGSPLIEQTGNPGDWNETGMHTLDRIDSTLTVVDAKDGAGVWSIGFYKDS